MKKVLAILLAATTAFSLAACGAKPADTTSSGSTPSGSTSTPAPAAAPIVVQIGYEMNPGEPLDLACQKWAELLEEKSGGSMTAELFPSSQLGSKDDLMDQMIAGEPVITTGSAAYFADRGAPDMGITFGPYMFENWEQLDKVLASDWWSEQCDLLNTKGYKVLSSWHFGERHTMTSKPVNTPADFKSMKLRLPSNKIQIEGFNVLGVAAVPMPLGEVYTALQQGTIDGLENPLATLYAGKYQEVAKNLILDGHVKDFTSWACGSIFFDSLTPEQQEILVSSATEAGLFNNEISEKGHQDALEKMKSEGVNVIEVNYDEFKEATKSFYELDAFKSIWSEGLYERIQGIINE